MSLKTEVVIRVENLTKIYHLYDSPGDRFKEALHPRRKKYHHDFYALRDVSFEIRKGETVGIIGRNGSGKSTLLKILTGVLTPNGGRCDVKGKVSSLLELGTGFNPELTGIENVYFNGTILGFSKEEMDAKLDNILAFADIGEFVHQPVKSYSSGMFVRLAFAVAISVDPDILIVDEALSVGDIRFQYKCNQKFVEFRKEGKTFLLVSHSTGDIVRLCKRAIWLNDGIIKNDGLSKFVTEEYIAWMAHDTGLLKPSNNKTETISNSIGSIEDNMVPIPQKSNISGEGGAVIETIGFFNEENTRILVLDQSDKVKILFKLVSDVRIENPWIGFSIINNKGIRVFGSNSYGLEQKIEPIKENSTTMICFSFIFPEIENGAYLISVAINDGTPEGHIRLYNIIDAYEFEFNSNSLLQKQTALLKLKECDIVIS